MLYYTIGREAASRDENPPSPGHCPPGGMQILIDPESREITIVTSPQQTSSNRIGEASGNATNRGNDAADNEEEDMDSDGSGRRRYMCII